MIFKRWKELHPHEIMPRWVLAENYIKKRQYQEALELVSPANCDNKILCKELQEKVRSRATTLLSKNFMETYYRRLVQNRYD